MLHILFLILKIIGIILLVILGIALTLVGVVLFVPVRYRLKMETTNGMNGLRMEAKATWLFHLLSAFVNYQEEELDWQVRIGWKKIKASEEDVDLENGADLKGETTQEETTQEKTTQEETTQEKTMQEGIAQRTASKQASEKAKTKDFKEKENWFDKIKCTIKEIYDKIKRAKDLLMDEANLQALLHLKNVLVIFLKRIKPDKIKGYIRFGLEDPYNTGRVLALLSVLYPFYGENVQIYPEFEKEILEGDVLIKGRIHLIHLLIAVCKLYFDDNVKMAYKNLKTLKEKGI